MVKKKLLDLYCTAENFFIFFDSNQASEKVAQIQQKNKLAVRVNLQDNKIAVFQLKKII